MYIRAGFFKNLTAKIKHSHTNNLFLSKKKISKEVNIQTFYFPFLFLFKKDFFAFGFWSFSQSKDCNLSSKIML